MRKMLWAFGWEMEEYIKTNGFCNDYELLLCNRMTVDVHPDWLIRHLVTCKTTPGNVYHGVLGAL
jgi:hypothetical protein